MQDDLPEINLPANGREKPSSDGGGNHLYVNQFDYHANDLTELRKLAETNPDLAIAVVKNQENQSIRKEFSYRLGLVVASLLACVMIGGGIYLLTEVGIWNALFFVLVLLGCSHVLGSVLKGTFAETSWFGAFLKSKNKPDSE